MKKEQRDCSKNFDFIMHQLKKPKIKKLNNVDLLRDFLFYDENSNWF